MSRIKKHMLLFLFPVAVGSAAVSCGPGTPHEIISEEKGYLVVNLESKVEPAELKEIARYYFDDHQKDGMLVANFCIPSEYPDYPETPWAMVAIDAVNFPADHPQVYVQIHGSKNEAEKQELINCSPDVTGIKGKWYFNEPMLESVYFLVENENDTLMLIYDAVQYSEIEGEEPLDLYEPLGQENAPDYVEQLYPCSGDREYCVFPFTESSYRINEKGELILLNRQKTGKDTSRCVLQPLP
jgi:hypothetical protein